MCVHVSVSVQVCACVCGGGGEGGGGGGGGGRGEGDPQPQQHIQCCIMFHSTHSLIWMRNPNLICKCPSLGDQIQCVLRSN